MTALVATYDDGSIFSVPVKWHELRYHDESSIGLWTTISKVRNAISKCHPDWNKSQIHHASNNLAYAEVRLEVYNDCEDGEPWMHSGILKDIVPYAWDPCFG